jgi:CubicO group peptidase (beta-lactamase class C family)
VHARRSPFLVALVAIVLLATVACTSSGTAESTADGDGDGDGGTTTTSVDASTDYDFAEVDRVVADFVAENGLNGAGLIVVDEEDGVVHEEHWGDFDEDHISLIASSSKMISAGVLLHLADQGLLDMDAPIAEVVDWGEGNPDITPAQLVSNSSGLVGLIPEPTYAPYLCQFDYNASIQECAESIFTTDADDADVVPPDTEFRYGGAQWQVAGAVAEAASGKSWDELVEEIYVEPCSLETLGYNNHFVQFEGDPLSHPVGFDGDPSSLEPTDNPNLEGGAYINTGDYGLLLLMHLRDGKCGDTQVLSPEALAAAHGDRVQEAYGDAGSSDGASEGYGMGWWIDRASGRINDPGAFGAVAWLDLEDGYGAYLVVEAGSAAGNALAAQLYDLVDAAVNAS